MGSFADTTYPREGTETSDLLDLYDIFARHNLSPRGDGNKREYFFGCSSLTQLIPARGRKPSGSFSNSSSERDTTYPREGTETIGKPENASTADDTTYPREGTETERFLDFFQKWQ